MGSEVEAQNLETAIVDEEEVGRYVGHSFMEDRRPETKFIERPEDKHNKQIQILPLQIMALLEYKNNRPVQPVDS